MPGTSPRHTTSRSERQYDILAAPHPTRCSRGPADPLALGLKESVLQDTVAQSNAPRTPVEAVPLSVSPLLVAATPQRLTRREIAWAALGCALVVSLFLS